MELCECPDCGLPAEVEDAGSHDDRPGDTVRVRCLARHWFLGPRRLLVPGPPLTVGTASGRPPSPPAGPR